MIHVTIDHRGILLSIEVYSVAFAFSAAARSTFAFSRRMRRSNFPLGFFGMASMNSTPPLSHLY